MTAMPARDVELPEKECKVQDFVSILVPSASELQEERNTTRG